MKTWLVPEAQRRPTPNIYDSSKPEDHTHIHEPIACILHYTADDFKPSLNTLTNPAAMASAHFIVDRDGSTWQLAALEDRTWHAGGRTSALHGMHDVNSRTVGIEIVNYGLLHRDGPGSAWKMWRGREVPDDRVFLDPKDPFKKAWEAYPEGQVVAVIKILQQLSTFLPTIKVNPDYYLLGHQDVDPTRKLDPGPAFPWSRARSEVKTPKVAAKVLDTI